MDKVNKKTNAEIDSSLIKDILNGDEKTQRLAWKELHDRYRVRLFHTIRKKTYLNDAEVEDLVSKVFEKLATKLSTFRGDTASFNTWIHKVTKNVLIDKFRSLEFRTNILINYGDLINNAFFNDVDYDGDNSVVPILWISDELDPEELIIENEEKQVVRNMINAFSPKQQIYKRVIELRYFEERTYKEMCLELNLSVGAVKTKLHKAKKILKKTYT